MKIFSEIFALSKAQGQFLIDFRTPTNIRNLSYGVWTDARYGTNDDPDSKYDTVVTGEGNRRMYMPGSELCGYFKYFQ